MITSLVVAASTNNAIGKNNQLLWHLPNDLKFFKNVTWAMPVAMGRKTFESFNSSPLKGRLNIIITRQNNLQLQGAAVVNSLQEATRLAEQNDYNELMIIGGGTVYKEAISSADKIYITRVHHIFNDADTFFPEISTDKWKLVSNADYSKDDKHAFDYNFQLWVRN